MGAMQIPLYSDSYSSSSSGQSEDVFQHDEAVYGLSTDPNNENIFASACDDGRVLVYDTREPTTSGSRGKSSMQMKFKIFAYVLHFQPNFSVSLVPFKECWLTSLPSVQAVSMKHNLLTFCE